MYVQDFCVRGSGAFPLDMLRYDCCYPARGDDVAMIPLQNEERDIHLRRRVATKHHPGPTVGRWDSFSWRVVFIDKPVKVV